MKGFGRTWNARNCDNVTSKTDRKICLRFQRKHCYIKLHQRLESENKHWPKRKIVFSCKKRQKRDRCVNYYLKDKSRRLKRVLKRRYQKYTYSYRRHKKIARKMCKKKVSKIKYKDLGKWLKLIFMKHYKVSECISGTLESNA